MPGECLLRRELLPGGRSRAFCQRHSRQSLGSPGEIAERLVDIHSQQQNQQLASERYQLDVIDSLADNAALLADYRKGLCSLPRGPGRYTDTRDMLRRNRDDAEYLTYQYEQPRADESSPESTRSSKRSAMSLPTPLKSRRILPPPRPSQINARPNVLEMLSAAVEAVENPPTLSAPTTATATIAFAERLSRRASRFRT